MYNFIRLVLVHGWQTHAQTASINCEKAAIGDSDNFDRIRLSMQ